MVEIKEIPKDWKWVKLGDVLSVSSGKGIKVNSLQGGKYAVYGGNGLNGYHSEYLIEDSKLIIGRVGVKCGVTHITKPKSWVTDNALIVEPKNDAFDIRFLKLKLGYENLNKLSVSTAQPVISGSKIYAYEILLPPKPTQQAIVSKIEELFSELDKGIENLRVAQQQLKTYRQAVLKWAFEGKLTNENVKEGELPEGWKWTTLGEICDPNRKCSYGVLVPGNHVENGVTLVRVGDINDKGVIDQNEMKKISPIIASKFKRTFLEGGEVVISLVGRIGSTAVVPSSLKGANTARAVGVIPVSKNVSAKFVEAMLRSPDKIREHNDSSHEVARKTLNLEDVVKSKIPLPSFKEQNKIVQEIEARLSVADKMEESINQSLQQAEALRQSILKKAFEGRLVL